MSRCPTCNRELDDAAEFCPFDGSPLGGGPRAPRPSNEVEAISAKDDRGSAVAALEKLQGRPGPFDSLIGQTLDGRYRVERVLGEGGMGVVFLAQHVVIEKPVAIKILKPDAARSEDVTKRFVREARAASRIGHPNIIDVTDFGTTPQGVAYSVMEYIEGATLSRVIRDQAPMAAARVLHIAEQMARALAAAHEKGVVHRDLKPDNVFLIDRGGRPDFVKIVDFGIARVLPIPGNSVISRLTRVGSVFGTPEYMAPEQASGRTDSDHRVDVYALGTIMFEMLTGKVPHKGDSAVRTLAMQMLDPTPTLRDTAPGVEIDVGLEALVMKALAKKREDRFEDMASMLEAILAQQGRVERAPASAPTLSPSVVAAPGAPTVPENPAMASEATALAAAADTAVPSAAPTATSAPTEIYQSGPVAPAPTSQTPPASPGPSRAVLWGIGGVASVVAVAAAIFIATHVGGEKEAASPVDAVDAAAVAAADAGAAPGADAALAAVAATDAAAPSLDAAVVGRRPQRRDAGAAARVPPPRPGFLDLEVITRPTGGAVYVDGAYAGADGVNVRRRRGTRARIRCTKVGYQPGEISVRYDGRTDLAVCRMKKRAKKCVAGIKNPFEKCP